MEIILASKSPRRREILNNMGITDFAVIPAEGEEEASEAAPGETVEKIAQGKALAVASAHPDAVVIAAYLYVPTSDWAIKWLPIVSFPPLYLAIIIVMVAAWFFVNLYLLRSGGLNFITDLVDKWYRKKVDGINHTNLMNDQGIRQDPFGDFTNRLRDANDKFVSTVRKKDDKDDKN